MFFANTAFGAAIQTYLLASFDDENVATMSVWKGVWGVGQGVWLLNGISSIQVGGKTLFCIMSPVFDVFTRLCKAVWSHHSPCLPLPPPSPPPPLVRAGVSLTLLMKTEQTQHQKITERH